MHPLALTPLPVALTSTGIFNSLQDKAETIKLGDRNGTDPNESRKEDQPSGPASGSNFVFPVWPLHFSERELRTYPGSSSGDV
ncbi:hypothetical protein BDV29DRAFT_185805 [Aspergillus leporis]|jgi:hypothetical protein|uniref:Uncharacterized protein n=1 Tax=Aspergillus leporis TaxID=41062 RepID=A0A5N5WGZ5_9EURO|nr:hypothetical protein BDV29DRAFT_185805 [Aspergillus leporis]